MKRIVLSLAVIVALVFGGAFATTAKADGHGHRHHGHHGHHHHGHHHHGHHHHGHHHYSRPSYGVYYAPAPYSYGYSTYPGYYYSRPQPQPRIGFYIGF